MQTSLYEKVFIDGFHKPSYVVATLALDRAPSERELAAAIVTTLELHPRLRSLTRTMFGVPVALIPQPATEWLHRGGLRVLPVADIHALEEVLLSTPIDLQTSMPLEVYLVEEPAVLVVKVHHAVIDATSGFALLRDFSRVVAGRTLVDAPNATAKPWDRLVDALSGRHGIVDWVTRAQLRPRVPNVSVTANYNPIGMLEEEPVTHTERIIQGGFPRIAERASGLEATFSEFVASALLSAMFRYNAAAEGQPPEELGLMVARARPRARQGGVSFSADTRVVSIPAAQLDVPHRALTLRALRDAGRDNRHNDLALAALYAIRKWKGRERMPSEQRAIHFTLSDVTAFGRRVNPSEGSFGVRDMRVLASPTSFDHAGMLVSRFGDDVRLSLVSHRGAVDANTILATTITNLEES